MQIASHANCCGVVPITVTGDTLDSDELLNKLVGIVQAQSENPTKASNSLYEIILNDTQARQSKRLLELMAKLGFVFVARTNNGRHDSWINVFHRCHRNGRPYVKPTFEWNGPRVENLIAEHQPEPVKFKKPEVPNPFIKTTVFAYA